MPPCLQAGLLTAERHASAITIKIQRPASCQFKLRYQIGRRNVCRCIWRHCYPVSEPSLYRYEAAKRAEAANAYALRDKKPPDGSDLKHDGMEQMDRGYRGMHCIAWLRKYVAQACEHIPDVALRLLPCRKLADMHREYQEDQKSNPSSPLPVKVDAFRRIFHHCPDFADCKISDSKCNFGRCSTCRKGEMAIRRSAKGDHYEGLAAAKFDRYQHLLQIKMEKVSYYFEREMSRSPVALKVSLIIDKVLLALASIPSFITHHVHCCRWIQTKISYRVSAVGGCQRT